MIFGSFEYISSNLLTPKERSALSSIEQSSLYKVFKERLLATSDLLTYEIAVDCLKIISETKNTIEREKFLYALLLNTSPKLKELLGKVNTCVQKGYFEQLLKTFETDKLNYHSQEVIENKIERFIGEDVPVIISSEKKEIEDLSSILLSMAELDSSTLNHLFERFKAPHVAYPIDNQALEVLKSQYLKIQKFYIHLEHNSFEELMKKAHAIRHNIQKGYFNPSAEKDERLYLIAIGALALKHHTSFTPYPTQILAVLGLLHFDKNVQAEVKTGEGKSTIVALFTFVMSMECHAVDLVTSARYLAKRDWEHFLPFFRKCDIETGHICENEKKQEMFRAQVLYAPAFDFEFAFMEDVLSDRKFFEERKKNPYVKNGSFDIACLDESDNLLIDTAQNGARIAFPAEETYEWIYPHILLWVKRNSSLHMSRLNIVNGLRGYLNTVLSNENKLVLSKISEDKITSWIYSATSALYNQKENDDYVVRLIDGERVIQIVERSTGRISEKSRWQNGLHEFLEVMHEIEVDAESISPISLSHAVFYSRYKKLTALTGTAESWQTNKIYKMKSFAVPPYKPSLRVDLETIITENKSEQVQRVLRSVREMQQLGRPILILCQSILESDFFAGEIKKAGLSCHILNEVQEEKESDIVGKMGKTNAITIATNAAGRGTDVVLDKDSLRNGGFHVCFTFYPKTKREEDQGRGRAGRQGQKGSSQIILNKEDYLNDNMFKGLQIRSDLVLDMLKRNREIFEENQQITHERRALFEKEAFNLLILFFSNYRSFSESVQDEKFIDYHTRRLSGLKFSEKKTIKVDEGLSRSDKALAEDTIEVLNSSLLDAFPWKILIRKAIKRTQEKALMAWSEGFYRNLSDMIQAEQMSQKAPSLVLGEIKQLYDRSKHSWEKYIAKDGSGVFVTIKECLGISLA